MGPPDDLSPDRANRIADAVDDIERNVSRLRELQRVTREEYKAENNLDTRDATERKFEKLAEAVLDVVEVILEEEGESVPERRKEKLDACERIEVVGPELASRLREAIEFRDVLSHTYGPIVNDDIVYDSLQNSLGRYVEFVEAVDEYLSSESRP